MSDRNWDAEMKKIDRAMDRAPAGAAPPVAAAAGKGGAMPTGPVTTSAFGVFTRLGLAVALGIGIIFWPYSARCGGGLAAYLASVGVLLGAGVWSAVWTWRHRAARGHTLALLIVLWGLLLAAIDVLPRIGYAVPTALHPHTWVC